MMPAHEADSLTDRHLTEEQITDLLAGEAAPDAMKHMAACRECQEEMAALDEALLDFNQASLQWAEREAARRIHPPSRLALRWEELPGWAAATAAAVLAAAALLGAHVRTVERASPDASLASAATPVQHRHPSTELAQDNQLLQQIDSAVGQGYDSPVSASDLSLQTSPNHDRSVEN